MTVDSKLPAVAGPASVLAPREAGPAAVVVYLQGHARMRPNLVAVLRLLGQGDDVTAFPWEALRYEHVETIRAKLVEAGQAPAYARKNLIAVKGVLRTTWKLGRIDRETYERAIDVDPIKGDSAPTGRMLAPEEVQRMLEAAETTRDRALLAMAAYSGLRREELSSLDLASLKGGTVTVIGKGGKRREVFLAGPARVYLDDWLAERTRSPGPLFYPERRGGHLVRGARLSASGVWDAIRRLAEAAEIENVTPHDFRRTFASTLLDEGTDLPTVQKLLGHASPATTVRYDRRGDEPKKAAAEKLAQAFARK